MKTWKIALITFWVITALILTLLLVMLMTDNPWNERFEEMFSWSGNIFGGYSSWGSSFDGTEVEGEASISASGIDSIKISWLGGKVDVRFHDSDTIRMYQTAGSGDIPDDRKLAYRVSNGLLAMREGKSSVVRSRTATSLIVYLPQGMRLVDADIEGVSTDVEVWSIVAGEMELDTVSGRVGLYNVEVESDLKANTVSGRVELSDTSARSIDMTSVSGRLKASGAFGVIAANTVSGDIEVYTSKMPSDVELDTVSGSMTLGIPENSGFTAKYSKVSGSFSCDFATPVEKNRAVYGDGSADIDLNTVSGSMAIERVEQANGTAGGTGGTGGTDG